MPEKIKVEVVTPKGVVVDKMVEEVVAPGVLGEFGVLVGHTPMLTFIKPGILSYLENNAFVRFAVGAGFCEVLRDSVTVLVDDALAHDQVDAAAVAEEIKAAEAELATIDSAADPIAHQTAMNKLQLARAKQSLVSGGGPSGH
jgi:F-type H+-transporting ATPase subunit epsilon